jgi:hypothetical protein
MDGSSLGHTRAHRRLVARPRNAPEVLALLGLGCVNSHLAVAGRGGRGRDVGHRRAAESAPGTLRAASMIMSAVAWGGRLAFLRA